MQKRAMTDSKARAVADLEVIGELLQPHPKD